MSSDPVLEDLLAKAEQCEETLLVRLKSLEESVDSLFDLCQRQEEEKAKAKAKAGPQATQQANAAADKACQEEAGASASGAEKSRVVGRS